MSSAPWFLVLCLVVSACSESGGPPDGLDGEDTTTSSSIPVEPFLLLSFGGATSAGQSIAVLDTETGEVSQLYPTVDSASVAVSPDSQRVAYGTVSGVTIARVSNSADGPALTTELEISNGELGGGYRSTLRWTPDGKQLVYNDGVIDANTGETFRCEPRDNIHARHATIIPGGHDVVCNTDRSLRRDGEIRAALADGFASSDGQFLNVGTHVPTAAQPLGNNVVLFGGTSAMPTGEFASFPTGVHGDFVVSEAAGFVTLYRVETSTAPPEDGSIIKTGGEVGAAPGNNSAGDIESWPLADALTPFFTDGEGRRYALVGKTPDGESVFYTVRSHRVSADGFSNALYEQPVEGALVSVSRDGSSRGFRTSPFGVTSLSLAGLPEAEERQDLIPEHLKPFFVADLSNADQIVPIEYDRNGRPSSWAGWLNGEAWVGSNVGTIAPNGQYFARARGSEVGQPATICVTQLSAVERPSCLDPNYDFTNSAVLDFVGYNLKAQYQTDAPTILGVSRAAAYEGSEVSVFGARFGTSGTLRVGDVLVPASAITEWSDTRITFAMTAELPDSGAIAVETGEGSTSASAQRRYWLHQTTYVGNAFDDVPNERVALSQGLNAIDLGSLTDFVFEAPFGVSLLTSPELFSDDNQLYIYYGGSSESVDGRGTLIAGDMTRQFIYSLSDELGDSSRWQPVFLQNRGNGQQTMFAPLLDGLVNVGPTRLIARSDGSRVDVGPYDSDGKTPFIRETSDGRGLWRIRASRASEPRLWLQTGWEYNESNEVVDAVFSDQVTVLPFGLEYVEDAGDVVLITGTSSQTPAYALSLDSGQTFGEPQLVTPDGDQLREPIRVDATRGAFFLVMSAPSNAPGLLGVHAISLDGTFTEDFAAIPPGELGGGLVNEALPVSFARRDGELVLFFPLTNTLVYADFDEPLGEGESYSWTTLPADTDEGSVVSIYHEEGTDEVYAVLDDGTVMRATTDWTQWEAVDLQFDLAIPTTVVPRAIGRLADGRWIADAVLYDARQGNTGSTPSPLRDEAYLVSP